MKRKWEEVQFSDDDGFNPSIETITIEDSKEAEGVANYIREHGDIIDLKEKDIVKRTNRKTSTNKKTLQIKKIAENQLENIIENSSANVSNWISLGVDKEISAVLCHHGYNNPTEIQKASLPRIWSGQKDMIIAAETGSGKTLCYAIPIIQIILSSQKINSNKQKKNKYAHLTNEQSSNRLTCIVMSPTRELAIQIGKVISTVIQPFNCSCATLVGGLSIQKQNRLLHRKPDIVVATPGRLWDLMNENSHEHLTELAGLRLLAIDEVDRLLELGHFKEIKSIMSFIRANCHYPYQTIVLSATLAVSRDQINSRSISSASTDEINPTIENNKIGWLVKNFNLTLSLDKKDVNHSSQIIDLTTKSVTSSTLEEMVYFCQDYSDKLVCILHFLFGSPENIPISKKNMSKFIIFVNTIDKLKELERFTTLISEKTAGLLPKIPTFVLHSHKIQKKRLIAIENFTSLSSAILLTTDVASRGIDIPLVDVVIHFDTPTSPDLYVHRSGRTARNNVSGASLLFVLPEEKNQYKKILSTLKREQGLSKFRFNDCSKIRNSYEAIKIAEEIITQQSSVESSKKKISWYQRRAGQIDTMVDDTFCPIKKYIDPETQSEINSTCKKLSKVFSFHIRQMKQQNII